MKLNILVTAAGSAIGQGIIKAIKISALDCNIITTDNQPYAAGLYRGKAGYLVPLGKSPDFIDKIIEICKKEHIHGILIGTDYELLIFSEHKEKIEKETGAKVIVSPSVIVKIADDKWLTQKFLIDNNLPHIPSALPSGVDELVKQEGFPLIIKPRIGDSSKDTYIIKDKKELDVRLSFLLSKKNSNEYLSKDMGPMVQKYLVDQKEEYTSTTLTFDKKCYGVISMKREMKFGGHTTKAVIEDFSSINEKIRKIAEAFNAFGPANFQSRLLNDNPLVFEINCRFSGTTPFCAEVGFNTVEAVIRKVILKEKIQKLNYKKGVILRYFNEIFIPESEIRKIERDGFIKNSKSEINEIF